MLWYRSEAREVDAVGRRSSVKDVVVQETQMEFFHGSVEETRLWFPGNPDQILAWVGASKNSSSRRC